MVNSDQTRTFLFPHEENPDEMYNFVNACLGFAGLGIDGTSHLPHVNLACCCWKGRLSEVLEILYTGAPWGVDEEKETGAWGVVA